MKMKTLHEQALSCAKRYLTAESDLIAILQAVDACRGYREYDCDSLFEYACSLGLSKDVAYNLIAVARKSREVPALHEKIREGAITLSNARTIVPVLTPESQDRWLEAASTLSKHQLEREIVKENPRLAVMERVKPIAAERLELKIGISERLHQELKRAQEIVSSKTKKAASLEETIEMLAKLFLEKEDPVEKAKRARPARKPSAPEKREVPAALKHQIRLRDNDQCTHTKAGKRCIERKWLDIHHIQPVSEGGLTLLENLTTLCRGHHRMLHSPRDESREFGRDAPEFLHGQ